MIKFSGCLSDECRQDMSKRAKRKMSIIFSISLFVMILITVILGVLQYDEFKVALFCTVVFAIVTIFISLPTSKRRQEQLSKIRPNITILIDDELIINDNPVQRITKQISKVKKVLKCDKCYYIIFKNGDISNAWICQKDLLVEGNLTDFERIFAGKIVQSK